jgi:copper homeostasis protein (lipoprotein)
MTGWNSVRALAMWLVCVASVHGSADAQISGTATFRERIALPAEAVFDATLEDVSQPAAPAIVIGRARIRGPRTPPIKFQIPFDASRIDPGHRYVVQARILSGTRPIFATDRGYPVLTGGNGRQVALSLRPTAPNDAVASEPATPVEPRAPAGRTVVPPNGRPATFAGDLPCSDCTAVRYQLELYADETYFMRRTFVGRPRSTPSDDIGTWALSRDGRTLTLARGSDAPIRIAIGSTNTLHVLGVASGGGSRTRGDALKLTTSALPLEPRLRMRGMYRNVADEGLFTECLTHKSWPVAQERDNLALEAAYAGARRSPGDAVLVEVVGRVALRERGEGSGRERVLVVERFGGARPAETCGSESATPAAEDTRAEVPLENTHWTLTRVGDTAVDAGAAEREPHIVLHSTTHRVSGAAGCNQLLGSYSLDDTDLTFGTLATSRMACPSTMQVERRFLAALRATRSARVRGPTLELLDANGRFLARLEAREAN